jgi:hypothetical protein
MAAPTNPSQAGRPVEIWNPESGYAGRAIFLGWSTMYEELEGGPGQHPAAIIEAYDGWVSVVAADWVRFMDRMDREEAQ